jgi:hypothetical protein
MGRVALAIVVLACWSVAASAAFAQSARATGVVRDLDGKPVRGATIRASNAEAYPPQIVSTTDDRGRWAMIGLRTGTYTFHVEAPGFYPIEASVAVRTVPGAPLVFALARDPGPIPGALPANIQAQLSAANMLRDQGRLDQAISAYQEIRARSPKLSYVNLVLGQMYRQKAQQEADPGARRTHLTRAIEAYSTLLETAGDDERVRRELETARAEAAAAVD